MIKANSSAILHDVRLHKEGVFDIVESIHGNFDQDYINQFDKMIIRFKYTSLVFE